MSEKEESLSDLLMKLDQLHANEALLQMKLDTNKKLTKEIEKKIIEKLLTHW